MARPIDHPLLLVALVAAVGAGVGALMAAAAPGGAEAPRRVLAGVPYREGDGLTAAMRERCRLDLSLPAGAEGFATIVWFHAGGLTGGDRWIPDALAGPDRAVVAAGYRLSPASRAPAYIEDAAAAVAWTLANIERHGGDPGRVYVAGHSAGAYLASMIALDRRWLEAHGADPDDLAGVVPISGHAVTHFTVRAERGVAGTAVVVDELAPLHHVRADAPPIRLITGDRELEMLGRYEENAFLWRMLRVVGHERVELMELDGYDHGGVVEPALPLVARFVERAPAGG